MSDPFASVMRWTFPSAPGSSSQAKRYASTNVSRGEPRLASFLAADWACNPALSATTHAKVQQCDAFMVDFSCRSPARQLFMGFRIPSPLDLDV